MDLNEFIGKENDDLEKAFGFTHYLELKDDILKREFQDHKATVEAFFRFVDGDLSVIKTDNGVIKESFNMGLDKIKENLLLLEKDEGLFYDDDVCISYAFLGKNFFAYLLKNMLMFSAKEEDAAKMAKILDEHDLKYFEPYEIGKEVEIKDLPIKKLGRNEPCHCGSGKKYKKCCLEKDIK